MSVDVLTRDAHHCADVSTYSSAFLVAGPVYRLVSSDPVAQASIFTVFGFCDALTHKVHYMKLIIRLVLYVGVFEIVTDSEVKSDRCGIRSNGRFWITTYTVTTR